MADSKVTDLTLASAALGTHEHYVNEGGLDRKSTNYQIHELLSKKGSDVASAATVTLGDGEFFHITGTVTITDIDFTNSWNGRRAILVFDGSLALTHNATTLICPNGVTIQTQAGDSCMVVVESGDNVRIAWYNAVNPITGVTAVTTPAPSDVFMTSEAGVLKKITGYQIQEISSDRGADVASAATVTLGDGEFFHITGSVAITDIDFTNSWDGRRARLVFDGSPLLTYNATTLILPGRANIQCGPGDTAMVVVDSGDNVIITNFERASALQNSNPSNCSIANQTPGASATTLLTDSVVPVPLDGVKIRSRFLWHVILTKTAAGTVAPVLLVKMGIAGTTADGTILTFTFPVVGTAVADTLDAWIEFVVVGPLTSACVPRGSLTFTRALGTTATGWLSGIAALTRVTGTPANFNATTAALKASLSITLGASYVVTVEHCSVETYNL